MNKRLYGLSLLTAVLYVLATPPVDLIPLGWFCLTPLLFAFAKSNSHKEVFKAGLVSGLASSVGLYYWLIYTMTTYGGLSYPLSTLLFILLAAYLAAYWSVFTMMVRYLSAGRFPLLLVAPCVWVSLEYLRTYLFTGFPWALLGYTQYKSPYLIQIAGIFGPYAVSFILVLSSVLVYQGINSYFSKRELPLKEIGLLLLLLIIDVSYGFIKIHQYEEPSRSIVSSLVQGNIDQGIKWNKGYQDETINIYGQLSKAAVEETAKLDVLIWPETAAPFYFQSNRSLKKKIVDISGSLNIPILFGSPAYKYEGEKVKYLNSAFLIAPRSENEVETLARYDKVHLVPFGEYVPLKKILFFVNKITEGIGDFSAGDNTNPLDLKASNVTSTAFLQAAGYAPEMDPAVASFGTLICYEAIFPDLVRRFVKNGANILVNITNDAWYGRSSAPYQHLSAAVFRAVENGTYMLRAANTGVTAIINPLGYIEKSTRIFTRGFVTGKVALRERMTLYTIYGDVFTIIVSIITVLMMIYSVITAKSKKQVMK